LGDFSQGDLAFFDDLLDSGIDSRCVIGDDGLLLGWLIDVIKNDRQDDGYQEDDKTDIQDEHDSFSGHKVAFFL